MSVEELRIQELCDDMIAGDSTRLEVIAALENVLATLTLQAQEAAEGDFDE